MANEIPVYLFVGFLESGKTKFIQETFEDPNFDSGDKTLLLVKFFGIFTTISISWLWSISKAFGAPPSASSDGQSTRVFSMPFSVRNLLLPPVANNL